MTLFEKRIYIKDTSYDPIYKSVNREFYVRSRFVPGILLAMGFIVLITQVVIPLVYFKTHDEISKPMSSSVLGVATGFGDFTFAELTNRPSKKSTGTNTPQYFYLTVPRLKIENALVETNSLNLTPDETLGHYRGSAIPGDVGNTFIYGHSVLPWFYNPKNYKTIFSTLDHLAPGDEIFITYDGNKLRYKVEYNEVVPTELVDPLGQYKPKYLNESTVTLMTCWPAGTKAKRFMVRAVKVD